MNRSERPVDALAVKTSLSHLLTTWNQEMLAHLKILFMLSAFAFYEISSIPGFVFLSSVLKFPWDWTYQIQVQMFLEEWGKEIEAQIIILDPGATVFTKVRIWIWKYDIHISLRQRHNVNLTFRWNDDDLQELSQS